MPIKERLFAKPCILWSPLALKCYLLVFIRPTSAWQLSPKFTDSYVDSQNLFPQENLFIDSLEFPLLQKIVSWVRPGGIYWLSICFHTNLVTLKVGCETSYKKKNKYRSLKISWEIFQKEEQIYKSISGGEWDQEVFIGCSSAFTQKLSPSVGLLKVGWEIFDKKRNKCRSAVVSHKKVSIGC